MSRLALSVLCLALPLLGQTAPAYAADPPAAAPAAPEPADVHPDTGIERLKADDAQVPVPPRDAARAAALASLQTKLACVCHEGGELRIDMTRDLTPAQCGCPQAERVRADLEQSLAPLPTAQLADKQAVAERIEAAFVPMDAAYERVFRFPKDRYDWFLQNVRCVCEGCKPTVFFSKCQLSCTPSIIYKLRARIFLSMGFSVDELIDYYLAEYNAGKPPREQVKRDWLLPGKQKEQGWLVPAVAILGAIAVLALILQGWVRRSRRPSLQTPATVAGPPAEVPPTPVADEAARRRLRAALDDESEGW